jgi:hypothetical protein
MIERDRNPDARPLELLLDEIRRYLDAIEVFRGEGCEPNWLSPLASEEARR